MNGKTVIVTGANAGIGKETARELAKKGARVILACRNMETGKQSQDEIIKETCNQNVILKKIDLSSRKSIRAFAEDINKTESQLHVLIHNAGIWVSDNLINEDGLEMTMATNHFGPFLLTHLLIDLLKKSAPSRIVIVSSVSHHFTTLNLEKLDQRSSLFPTWNYFKSKFANVCFTRELANRLKNHDITVNCLHPGMIRTNIWSNLPMPFSWVMKLYDKMFFKTSEEGCKTIVYLASSDEVANVTGKYFVNCKKTFINRRALDKEYTRKLWENSEKIVQLTDNDSRIIAVQ